METLDSPAYLNDLIFKNDYTLRYQQTVEVPRVRTVKGGSSSFRSAAAKIWNSLPQQLRDISSFGVFKNQLNTWSGVLFVFILLYWLKYSTCYLFSCKILCLIFLFSSKNIWCSFEHLKHKLKLINMMFLSIQNHLRSIYITYASYFFIESKFLRHYVLCT